VEVRGLVDPRMLVEVEAVAYRPHREGSVGSAADVSTGSHAGAVA
jgi:hypothetical protein